MKEAAQPLFILLGLAVTLVWLVVLFYLIFKWIF